MRNVIIFAGVMALVGIGMARIADTLPSAPAKSPDARRNVLTVASTAPVSAGRTVTLTSSRNGHFVTDARVNGSYLDFMVDTGATVIALKERDAARLGIRPSPSAFTALVSTANGPAKAART